MAADKLPVNNQHAALWLLASAVLFTAASVLVKYLGASLHAWQIAFFRGVVALLVIIPIFVHSGGIRAGLATQVLGLQLCRGVVGSVAMFLGFYAIVNMPLADMQAISFSRNLFVVPLAALILSEVIGWRRALATLVGFGGVLLMLWPNLGASMDISAFVASPAMEAASAALGHAFLVAFATILVNIASRYDKPTTLMFYTNVVSVVIIAIPTFFVWQTPSLAQLGLLVAMGILATSAHNCFIRAFAIGEASAIAPVDYSRLVLAAIVGYFLFADIPNGYTILGAAIIVGSSFYIIRREARLAATK